jgi:hypothetical protein
MRTCLALFCAASATLSAAADDDLTAVQGAIYTNEEQVYFDKDAGKPAPPWLGIIITPARPDIDKVSYVLKVVDAFGVEQWPPFPFAKLAEQIGPMPRGQQIELTLDGQMLKLRRARPVTCWVAIPKDEPRADGEVAWHFTNNIKLHDQGGRVLVGGPDSGTKPVVIRMRNVVWPPKADGSANSNRPSLVLYVHTPDEPDRAVSYVWADPDAARIGINLRWMQASCTVDGTEKPGG